MTTSEERSTWRHPLGFEIKMSFDGQGWQCECQALGIETMIRNQAPENLEGALADWINDHLHLKKAAQIVAPPKQATIWVIMSNLIGGDLVIAPRQEKVIYQQGERGHSVSLFHDRDGRLRLVVRNGRTASSPPIAHNPMSAPAGEWHLVNDARAVYDDWVKGIKALDTRRPLWHHRPAVDALMKEHNLSRDDAVEMYKEKV